MDTTWKKAVWGQFGAAIDMLERAIRACPDELFVDRSRRPEIWYLAYHTLFYLDYYLDEEPDTFEPAPFDTYGRAELLPEEDAPPFERAFTRDELLGYAEHGRRKCRARIEALTEESAARPCPLERFPITTAEFLLYNARHVQHHAAQLNLLLRQATSSAPRWVGRAE